MKYVIAGSELWFLNKTSNLLELEVLLPTLERMEIYGRALRWKQRQGIIAQRFGSYSRARPSAGMAWPSW